jgi:hypothetical protein
MANVKRAKWSVARLFGFRKSEPVYVRRAQVEAAIAMISENKGVVSLPDIKVSGNDRFATLRREAEQLQEADNIFGYKKSNR